MTTSAGPADDRDALAVERTRQVFRYLKDFSTRNAPVRRTLRDQLWSLSLTDLPARQAVLKRAGWRFVRLRGTRFFRNPDESMRWVFDELDRLGVRPVGPADDEAPPRAQAAALRDAVVRRAWAIMRDRGWLPTEPVAGPDELGGDDDGTPSGFAAAVG